MFKNVASQINTAQISIFGCYNKKPKYKQDYPKKQQLFSHDTNSHIKQLKFY